MLKQIIPDINIDNKKVVGLLENNHYYRTLLERFSMNRQYTELDEQYITNYYILLTKDNVSFFLEFDDRISVNFETELNVCWKNATFKTYDKPICITGETKELELAEHYFLSLKTDLRGEFPLSNILETQNILKKDEQILIRLELKPITPSWYREIEEHIKNFNKGRVTTKNGLSLKDIGYKCAAITADVVYTALEFINDMATDEKLEKEEVTNNRYSKLLRNGLSSSTQEKSKYNAYNTKLFITINSNRSELLFRNIHRSFNSMAGDNSFLLVEKSNYKNILSSKELAQIMQLPTKIYQETYKINNIDNREVDIPRELQGGNVGIGTATKNGKTIHATWPTNKNIMALPKVFIGPQNAGKTTKLKKMVKEFYRAGYSNIMIDYIEDCDSSNEIASVINEKDKVVIRLGTKESVTALAYNEVSNLIKEDMDTFERVHLANLLAEQVEYLINAITDKSTGELTAPMLRYLHSACMVVFIKPNAKIDDVFHVLRKWQVRNEYIRYAKYSKCFSEDDDIFYNLDELHERDKEGKITGTRENLIVGIINRIAVLQKNPFLKSMLKADIDGSFDFAKLIEEGKSIFIQIPQNRFPNKMIKDILATYYMSRIWLTVQLRKNNKDARLCQIIFDEVHQVKTCASYIKDYITEFRRHRLGLILTCHFLKQFKDLLPAVKSAGTSYMLFAGTEYENLKTLEKVIEPFTIKEGLTLKPYHSLNVINYGNQYAKFISKL